MFNVNTVNLDDHQVFINAVHTLTWICSILNMCTCTLYIYSLACLVSVFGNVGQRFSHLSNYFPCFILPTACRRLTNARALVTGQLIGQNDLPRSDYIHVSCSQCAVKWQGSLHLWRVSWGRADPHHTHTQQAHTCTMGTGASKDTTATLTPSHKSKKTSSNTNRASKLHNAHPPKKGN